MINDAITNNASMNVTTTNSSKTKNSSTDTVQENKTEQGIFDTTDTVEISDEARVLANAETAVEAAKSNSTTVSVSDPNATREGRDAEGKKYDEILKELREKYDEEEAIARFNDYMKNEGFEIQEKIDDETSILYFSSSDKSTSLMVDKAMRILIVNGKVSGYFNPSSNVTANSWSSSSNYNTYSTMQSDPAKGINGGTWAVYSISFDISDFSKTIEEWQSRNASELNESTGFDILEYANNVSLQNYDTFSPESASIELADIVKQVLEDGHFILEEDQELGFYIDSDENGNYNRIIVTTNIGDEKTQSALQNLFDSKVKENPEILNAFIKEQNSLEIADTSSLRDSFSSNDQSLTFDATRRFIYSAKESSKVVMGSTISVMSKGYSYQKKISSEFDSSADLTSIMQK